MNDEKRFSLDEVRAALETLADYALKFGADANCTWTLHAAVDDVVAILAGEWEPESQVMSADADEELVL